MATSRIASLARIASTLPEGSLRADLIRLIAASSGKTAGSGLDRHAAIQFIAGLVKQSPAKVEKALRSGDFAQNPKMGGVLTEAGFSPDGEDVMKGRLWDYVVASAQSALGGMRSMGDEILSLAGVKGVTGEDLASIYGYGGLMMPGMRWDGRSGKYVDRKQAKFPAGQSLYYKAGEAFRKDKKTGGLRQLKGWLRIKAKNLTKNWLSSVDAGKDAKFVTDEEGVLVRDFEGYEPAPVAEYLSQKMHLNRIVKTMQRELASAPGQLLVWNAVVDGMNKNKDLLKYKEKGAGKGDLTVQASALRKHLLEMMAEQVGDIDTVDERTGKPFSASIPSPQALQKNFTKILPKMMKAMEDAIHSGDGGSMGDAMKRDMDIMEVYEDAIRRRASRRITASERSAMIRLAAALPVGSPERRAILAGCEKLPEGPMRDNCEKKKEEGASDKKMAGKGKLPDALKKNQFTSKDGDNPPPADADGDGNTNEPKPDFLKEKGKKAALVRLAAALPVGSSERKTILRMAAGS
jgi:hypothetical protein